MDLAERYREANLPVRVIRGLEQVAEDGDTPMCRIVETMRAWNVSGFKARDLCDACPYQAQCPWFRQFAGRNEPGVVIAPHSYLAIDKDHRPFPDPDIAIIDESPLDALLRGLKEPIHVTEADLATALDESAHDDDLAATANRAASVALQALREGCFGVGLNDGMDLSAKACAEARIAWARAVPRPKIKDASSVSAEEITAMPEAAAAQHARRMAQFFGLLMRQINRLGSFNAFEILHTNDGLVVEMVWLEQPRLSCPTLLMDGTMSPDIVRQFLGRPTEETLIRVDAPHAHVTQIVETPLSMRKLGAVGGLSEADAKTAVNTQADLWRLMEVVAARCEGILVATYKATRGALAAEHENKVDPIRSDRASTSFECGGDVAHFGNMRGVDRWKNKGAVRAVTRRLSRFMLVPWRYSRRPLGPTTPMLPWV